MSSRHRPSRPARYKPIQGLDPAALIVATRPGPRPYRLPCCSGTAARYPRLAGGRSWLAEPAHPRSVSSGAENLAPHRRARAVGPRSRESDLEKQTTGGVARTTPSKSPAQALDPDARADHRPRRTQTVQRSAPPKVDSATSALTPSAVSTDRDLEGPAAPGHPLRLQTLTNL
jgi:hypothetical protein